MILHYSMRSCERRWNVFWRTAERAGCSRIGEKSRKKPFEAIKKTNFNEKNTKIQPTLEFCKQVRHELWESVRTSVNNAFTAGRFGWIQINSGAIAWLVGVRIGTGCMIQLGYNYQFQVSKFTDNHNYRFSFFLSIIAIWLLLMRS